MCILYIVLVFFLCSTINIGLLLKLSEFISSRTICDARKPTIETIKSYFNRNLNTSGIWLPQEKQMRWKQGIKMKIEKKTRETDVLSVHNARTHESERHVHRKEEEEEASTQQKTKCFVCVFTGAYEWKKRWHAFNIALRALVCTFVIHSNSLSFGADMPLTTYIHIQ